MFKYFGDYAMADRQGKQILSKTGKCQCLYILCTVCNTQFFPQDLDLVITSFFSDKPPVILFMDVRSV